MITQNDYAEMEVLVNGEWIKADVLKKLENGMCLYLVGVKAANGSYSMGACAPATEYRELKKTGIRVKSAVEIMTILQEEGYKIGGCGAWVHPDRATGFNMFMWGSCGSTPCAAYSYEPSWLEEVEVTA